jgi:hypothetical protein
LQGLTPNQRALAPFAITASKKYGIPASVLMSLMGQESDYGANTGPSSAGAFGVTQFIPSTAQTYGVVPGSSKKALTSQVEGAAHLLSDLGFKKDPQSALSGYSGGYAAADYNNPILANARSFRALDKVSGAGGGGSPYAYPFSKGISIGRTDMGIDPSGPGVIRAIGKARYVGQGGSGWPSEGGTGVGPVYKLLKGPLQGKRVYTYEGITPANLQPGQILRKGQVIAKSTGSSFETGFAKGRAAGFQPLASDTYSEGDVTKQGTRFRNLVDSLKSGGGIGGLGGASFGGTLAGGTGGGGFGGTAATAMAAGTPPAPPTSRRPGAGIGSSGDVTGLLAALMPQSPSPGGLLGSTVGGAGQSPHDFTPDELAAALGVTPSSKPKRRLATR